MGIGKDFELVSDLTYRVRALEARVRSLESGCELSRLRKESKNQLAARDREIRRLKRDVADAERRIRDMRRNWMQVYEDMQREHDEHLLRQDRRADALEKRALVAERRLDAAKDIITERDRELRAVHAELKEEQDRNLKLKAQLARDYENSSVPSSAKPDHKRIENGREKTGRAPGAQPGHAGHTRKRQVPTATVAIEPPEEFSDSALYRPTGKIITKQLVGIRAVLTVTQYSTPEFRKLVTGQRVHADFPVGVSDDVNYDGSVKAWALLLNSRYCMATDKIREFLYEVTDGALEMSTGMINGLCKEFSRKTQTERAEVFSKMLLAPVMGTDFTCARVNAEQVNVAVCATDDATLYFARRHKGHKGIERTPVKDYQGILVHDHDKTYYSYGSSHQECLAHTIRYLKDSIGNEGHLTWNVRMLELTRQMIHWRNSLNAGEGTDEDRVVDFRSRYQDIIACAAEEYEQHPPNRYYREGYNLYRRMDRYSESHLLFLSDLSIPSDNNRSERLLRVFKRKQKQAMSFRSFDNLGYLCDGLSLIASLRARKQNLSAGITAVFNRPYPLPKETETGKAALDTADRLGSEL
jgi:hypothetical protein